MLHDHARNTVPCGSGDQRIIVVVRTVRQGAGSGHHAQICDTECRNVVAHALRHASCVIVKGLYTRDINTDAVRSRASRSIVVQGYDKVRIFFNRKIRALVKLQVSVIRTCQIDIYIFIVLQIIPAGKRNRKITVLFHQAVSDGTA